MSYSSYYYIRHVYYFILLFIIFVYLIDLFEYTNSGILLTLLLGLEPSSSARASNIFFLSLSAISSVHDDRNHNSSLNMARLGPTLKLIIIY